MSQKQETTHSSHPVAVVTGASSGIGRAVAMHLSRSGYFVYGTSRHSRSDVISDQFAWLRMDVGDDASVQTAIGRVWEREGRIDAVINNAGFGYAGAIEDSSVEEFKSQFETNFFGVQRTIRAALPHMRSQSGGYIVNISSMCGLIGMPFQAAYSASKFALEGFTEALRIEVRPFGIHAVLIEPGDFRTDFTANRVRTEESTRNQAYLQQLEQALGVMERDEANGADPRRIAVLVVRILRNPSPRLRYTAGPLTQRLAALAKRMLPGTFFEWLLRKTYGLR